MNPWRNDRSRGPGTRERESAGAGLGDGSFAPLRRTHFVCVMVPFSCGRLQTRSPAWMVPLKVLLNRQFGFLLLPACVANVPQGIWKSTADERGGVSRRFRRGAVVK